MKAIFFALFSMVTFNALALDLSVNPDSVRAHLKADAVITVSKETASKLIEQSDTSCRTAVQSRSGRYYVVSKGHKSYLAATVSGLAGLRNCGEL